MSRIEADYRIETAYPLAEAAEAMAGEQSSGTFLPVPGETPELKARSAARVTALEDLGPVPAPSLPGAGRPDAPHRAARVTLSWPLDNMGPSLPNLMAAVAGNLFELKQFSGLRLLDLRLPEEFAAANPGPRFGIDGTRRARRGRRPAAHRHHRQAVGRPRPARRPPPSSPTSPPPASTSSRTTSSRATAPPAPSTTASAPSWARSTAPPTARARS